MDSISSYIMSAFPLLAFFPFLLLLPLASFSLISPLIIAGALHMVIVKFSLFSFLARPIHEGLFGKNKTWRGILVMPPLGILGIWSTASALSVFGLGFPADPTTNLTLLGFCLGLAYVVFELPNSYLKRKKGIAPGALAQSRTDRWIFFTLDHVDSLVGCILVYWAFLGSAPHVWFCLVLAPGIHIAVNLLLWLAGIRKNPF